MSEKNEPVKVYTAAGQTEAEMIVEMLKSYGVAAGYFQEGYGTAYGFTVGAFGDVDVYVPASQEALARDILGGHTSNE